MILLMWDGLDLLIWMSTRENFLVVLSIKVVLEYGLLIWRYVGFSYICNTDLLQSIGVFLFLFFLESTNKVINWQRLEPYATGTSTKLNGHSELKTVSSGTMPLQNDSGSRANIGRPSVLQNSENNLKTSSGRLSASQNSDSAPKETKSAPCMFLLISMYSFLHLMVKAFHMPYLSSICS